jgi:hypothetical protein
MITTANQTSVLEVFKTKNYEMFKYLEGNRSINALHLKRLMSSMDEQHLISPIIVNERYEIIDGQHRYEASKALNLPLYYIQIKKYGLSEVQRFNSNQKNFSYEDYLNGYCDLGYEDYIILKEFKDRYGFEWTVTLSLLAGSHGGKHSNDFKQGKFKIKDLKKADANAQKLEDFSRFYAGYKRKFFSNAVLRVINSKNYNHKQMMEKLKYLSAKLVDCSSSDDYLKILETIYNYKSRNGFVSFR